MVAVSWAVAWIAVFKFDVRFTNFLTEVEMDSNFSLFYLMVLMVTAGPIVLLFGSVVISESVVRPFRQWRVRSRLNQST